MTAIPATKAINLLVINFSRMAFQQQYDHVPSLKSKEEVRTKKFGSEYRQRSHKWYTGAINACGDRFPEFLV